jgi:hypothetical protein
MSTQFRHAGMGWPNGAVQGGNGRILALPSSDLLILGSEHWHHDEAVRAGKRVLFRGMARQGFRPAELGWDVRRYCDEITRDAVRVSEPITDFVAWNELNLQDERGDQRPDFGDLTNLYALLGAFCLGVVTELRRRPATHGARIHFGAWAPKDETDYTQHWRAAAEACDVIDVHAYGHGTGIVGHIEKYRALFPSQPVEITEWHSYRMDGDDLIQEGDDRETLALFANEAAVHPDFRAYYFLWRWDSPPSHQRGLADAIAVEGNPGRLALFQNPPTVEEPEMPKTREDVIAISNAAADEIDTPRLLLLAAGIAESDLRWDARRPADPSQDATFWPDVSFGPWQQTVRWSQEYKDWYTNDAPGHPPGKFPGTDVIEAVFDHYRDTEHAARVAARQLKAHYRPTEGDAVWRALNRYNFPSGDGEPKSPGIGQNYRRGIDEARAILGEPEPGASGIVYEDFRDPEPAGRFTSVPKGIILHGSRSGVAGNPKAQEALGTARYEQSNTAGLGWSATIGERWVAVHLTPQEWGWNARGCSDNWIGVEIAQATVDEPITDLQVEALADYIKTRLLPAWPSLPMVVHAHAELDGTPEYGPRDGKSDVFPKGDVRMDDLRRRLRAALGADPVPSPTFRVGPGIGAKMAEAGDAPASDELFFKHGDRDAWSEAYGQSGARYVYIVALNRTFRYDPAA